MITALMPQEGASLGGNTTPAEPRHTRLGGLGEMYSSHFQRGVKRARRSNPVLNGGITALYIHPEYYHASVAPPHNTQHCSIKQHLTLSLCI
ncbi:hypothetical protein FKM82_017815 [Ascaphus truei]